MVGQEKTMLLLFYSIISIGLAKFSKLFSLTIVITHHKIFENSLQKLFPRYFNIFVDKIAEIIIKRKNFSVKTEPENHRM